MIDVEVDGTPHQEMHVDGGAMAQVFLYPPRLMDQARASGKKVAERERRAYIIRNAMLSPDWATTERSTLSIVGRAINSLLQTQGIGDLYRIYAPRRRTVWTSTSRSSDPTSPIRTKRNSIQTTCASCSTTATSSP